MRFDVDLFLEELATFSVTHPVNQGVTRLPFSKEQWAGAKYIAQTMKNLGMEVYHDRCGTVLGILEGGTKDCILTGSHYDSVPCGGRFDGNAGIAAGLKMVDNLGGLNERPKYSLAVVAMNDEEGVRFRGNFLSSQVLCGAYTPEHLTGIKERTGDKTLMDCILENDWYNIDYLTLAQLPYQFKAFGEIHVEQGGILEACHKQLGIVDNIVGIRQFNYIFTGQANHAGTTPMHLRQDALVAASAAILKISQIAGAISGAVATVGCISVAPSGVNVIPQQAVFSVDMRAGSDQILDLLDREILAAVDGVITENPGVGVRRERILAVPPTPMDMKIVDNLKELAEKKEIAYMSMNSGAGHDAQIFAGHIPTFMLFVPSKDGLSHCKEEFSCGSDIAMAADLFTAYLENF